MSILLSLKRYSILVQAYKKKLKYTSTYYILLISCAYVSMYELTYI